jgi:hypothetical protein
MRTTRFAGAVLMIGAVFAASTAAAQVRSQQAPAVATPAAASGCQLKAPNGQIKHVIQVQFDNTHLLRDNPNVQSDLEQMPHLLNFIRSNGTLLANDHTVLIAHTAGGILSTLTGLYPDRHGQTVSNSYDYYKPDKTPTFTSSFKYWTDAVDATNDPLPNMVNGDSGSPKTTPAPWVPFTRAGCDVGEVSTANTVLENTSTSPSGDITKVFGEGSPEFLEASSADPATKAKAQTDFVGIAVHCGQSSALCAASPNAKADPLPDEPGGYAGFNALFGARYVNPAITGGQPVVNDLAGNPIHDPAGNPGFPGFDAMSASVSLGYVAQMQEAGVPITYAYISDAHDNHSDPSGKNVAYGPGEAGYQAQLKAYDDAFAAFFARLARDGINSSNTLFTFTVDEGDHFAGAQATGCDGTTTPCTYSHSYWTPGQPVPPNLIGEVNANIKSVLPATAPKFDIHFDSAPNFYVNGQPDATDPAVRQLERDAAVAQAIDPYIDPLNPTPITEFLVDTAGEKALHMVNADPLRTPTFTLFANPDFYFQTFTPACGAPVCVDYHFAWNHGDVSRDIASTWIGLVGPGVTRGNAPSQVWTDHTDLRPTMLRLVGLADSYPSDGRVITEALDPSALPSSLRQQRVTASLLGQSYKQLNAPFGRFGEDVLAGSTKALASGSAADDSVYTGIEAKITDLTAKRDALALQIRGVLDRAEFGGQPLHAFQALALVIRAQLLLHQADSLRA